jgi:predicted transcriptional regulator
MCTLLSEGTSVRTTIELRDDLRAKLLEIAGRRGEKGFSRLVEQAVERYVDAERAREEARGIALLTRGRLAGPEADDLAARAATIRENWR